MLKSNNQDNSTNSAVQQAIKNQGPTSDSVYLGTDKWAQGSSLKVGDKITQTEWRDENRLEKLKQKKLNSPAGAFFTLKKEADRTRNNEGLVDAKSYNESVQVAPRADGKSGSHLYSEYMSTYEVLKIPSDYAESSVRNNPHLGKGGADQFFFKNHKKLEQDGFIKHIEHTRTVNRDHDLPQYDASLNKKIGTAEYKDSEMSANEKAYKQTQSLIKIDKDKSRNLKEDNNKQISKAQKDNPLSREERILKRRQENQKQKNDSPNRGMRIKI